MREKVKGCEEIKSCPTLKYRFAKK